jgi:GNAT superfamily N-acetyltransferase
VATEIVQNRELALKVGYVSTDWANWPAWEVYDDALTEWEVRLIVRDGMAIGAVYTKGAEIHVSIRPEWRKRWITRGLLREIIPRPVAITRVRSGHEYMFGILERLGFEHRGDALFVRDLSDGH